MFGETTVVTQQADPDQFLDIEDIARQFAMMETPDGGFVLPLSIESSGIPPNSSANQQQAPLVDGFEIEGNTGKILGFGLVAVAAFLLLRSVRG